MHSKLGPWLPAIYCAVLSIVTVVANLIARFTMQATGTADIVFYCFLPMCFYFVGAYMTRLRLENEELREQIRDLASKQAGERRVA